MSEPRQLAKSLGGVVAQFLWSQNGNPQRIVLTCDQASLLCARAAELAIERTLADLDRADVETTKILKEF